MATLHVGKGEFLPVVVNLTIKYTEIFERVEFPTNPLKVGI